MARQRTHLLQIAAGAGLTVIVAVVVIVLASGGSSSAADPVPVAGGGADSLFANVPQEGLTVGKKHAAVELIEFGDLECPICKQYSEEVLPRLIKTQVDQGKVRLTFRSRGRRPPPRSPPANRAAAGTSSRPSTATRGRRTRAT
jgi:protein-disulfide isomerase